MPKGSEALPPDKGGRRAALKTMARFAIYVAPAMTVLVKGAEAHHRPGHCAGGPGGERICVSPV